MQPDDIVVNVTPQYLPDQSEPDNQHYVFAYRVVVRNNSAQAVQLISRHWVITDGTQRVQEVRGLGVVGKQPLIAAGESFEYSSGCPLPTPIGTMKGEFHFVGENGVPFDVSIAEFVLALPRTLH
ncbi:Co2+/Mg2+ efflux protein ApaG [Paenalcaligenes faecalis]|uniref:Co2+/Mg2+ efflux protein ApaG n=1 Tax=Paenalcaligenes faecalis TaxID=2980099 RepID=UPI0022B96B87|nr:Co2+/Mg2+ efflux protein ApaG [Paenalcaligenes faecalis]